MSQSGRLLRCIAGYQQTISKYGPMLNMMAALPNIGGAVCVSSVIPFLVPRRKVWLTPAARLPCSNAANMGERKTWTQSEFCTWQNSLRGARAPENVHIVATQETAKHRGGGESNSQHQLLQVKRTNH